MLATDVDHKINKTSHNYYFAKSLLLGSVFVFMSLSAHSANCKIPKSYYKNVSCTSDSRYFLAVKDTGEPVALLNKQGKKTADLFAYEQVLAHKMGDGLLPVRKKGKVGYINSKGVVAIPLAYDSLNDTNWARSFNNSRVIVKKKGKWGVVNTANRVIVPFSSNITHISDYSGGKAEMLKSGVKFVVDTKGQSRKVTSSKKQQVKSSSLQRQSNQPSRQNRLSRKSQPNIANNGSMINKNTEIVLPDSRINKLLESYKLMPQVNQHEPQEKPFIKGQFNQLTSSNMTLDSDSKNHTHMDLIGNEHAINTNNNIKLFPTQNSDGKWGFDDANGVNMITYSFDEVTPFSGGLAGVKLANNWGFINPGGDLVINFRFNDTGVKSSPDETYNGMPPFMFFNGKAWIGSLYNGKKLCIDKEGVNVSCDK